MLCWVQKQIKTSTLLEKRDSFIWNLLILCLFFKLTHPENSFQSEAFALEKYLYNLFHVSWLLKNQIKENQALNFSRITDCGIKKHRFYNRRNSTQQMTRKHILFYTHFHTDFNTNQINYSCRTMISQSDLWHAIHWEHNLFVWKARTKGKKVDRSINIIMGFNSNEYQSSTLPSSIKSIRSIRRFDLLLRLDNATTYESSCSRSIIYGLLFDVLRGRIQK